jgi:HrpA-like RNA helicase
MVKVKLHRQSLPVYKHKDAFFKQLRQTQALIVIGETGSGKTTQLPQYLLEQGFLDKAVGVTQPRRVAAISVAKRVAYERSVELGTTVGYSVRFDNRTSSGTKVKYLTDGMLIREAMLDPKFSQYSVIVVDEAHERSVNTDMILGLLKKRLKQHDCKLKVVVMSATIEAQRFARFFETSQVLKIEGRSYGVEILHVPSSEPDYIDAVIITVIQIHLDQPAGAILVFLSGQEEIEDVQAILERKRRLLPQSSMDLLVTPLYAALTSAAQMKVFELTPPNMRKVILATNIAETSITIPEVKYVVDSCRVKLRSYDPRTGMEALTVSLISKAAATQRAGRAGRECPGICYRMLTNQEFEGLSEHTTPEITRTNLASTVLQLKIIDDIAGFPFVDPPQAIFLHKATQELKYLGALDASEQITGIGRRMAELPVPPMYARLLLAAIEPAFNCAKDIVTIVALLNVENLTFKSKQLNPRAAFKAPEGDHLTLLNIFKEWRQHKSRTWCKKHNLNYNSLKRAREIRAQLKGYLAKYSPQWADSASDVVCKCLCKGFFLQSAMLASDKTHYRTCKDGEAVHLHPGSVLFVGKSKPSAIVFSEVVVTTKKYVREVTEVEGGFLQQLLASNGLTRPVIH